jgi:hypothetical protein
MKSVENNPNPVKAKVENRLKDGVRAAEACSVGEEIRTRAVRDPAKIADARRPGHLVGLTRGKNGSSQGECGEDERNRRLVFGDATVDSVRRRPRRLEDLRCHSLPTACQAMGNSEISLGRCAESRFYCIADLTRYKSF